MTKHKSVPREASGAFKASCKPMLPGLAASKAAAVAVKPGQPHPGKETPSSLPTHMSTKQGEAPVLRDALQEHPFSKSRMALISIRYALSMSCQRISPAGLKQALSAPGRSGAVAFRQAVLASDQPCH